MAAVFSQAKDDKPDGLNRQAVSGIFEGVGRHAVKHCMQRPNGQRGAHQRQSRRKSLEYVYIISHYVTRQAEREREPQGSPGRQGRGWFFRTEKWKGFQKSLLLIPPTACSCYNQSAPRSIKIELEGNFSDLERN